MIELANLEKTYVAGSVETRVLKDISLRIEAGEFVAIMGASGTGKSTLMNILGCLDKPTSGHYRLDGADMITMDDDALSQLRNRKLGFVFQQFHLLDQATALQNVMLPLVYADSYPEDARERAEKMLRAVDLADRMGYRPGRLSGGQQQRVAIARALITDPFLLLADEPTGNLDSKSGAEVMGIFQRLHRDGRTILLVTHDPAVAEHAHRVVVLKDGAVAEDRPVRQPRDAVAEARVLAEQEASR
ncbi:MAG: ABC transporter ATP-binding protein [Candidatus Riflebacteria bacterium]|nr:ABC transporter ATP-binding protein [Candidatus Riflebacteria bacterium]